MKLIGNTKNKNPYSTKLIFRNLTWKQTLPFIAAFAVLLTLTAFCFLLTEYIEPFSLPAAEPVRVVVWEGAEPEPEVFLDDIIGVDVAINFEGDRPVLYTTGAIDVELSLEDVYGNITYASSELQGYKQITEIYTHVDDDLGLLTIADFIDGEIQQEDMARLRLMTDMNSIDNSTVGAHNITIMLDGIAAPHPITVIVEDNRRPLGWPVFIRRWTVDELAPEDFVTDIMDQTEVTVRYINEPNRAIEGNQSVQVLLIDEGKNTTIISSTLWQTLDIEPPEITGEFNKAVCIGETILYRAGITVTDNRDEEVLLVVDTSEVDPATEGVYPVFYSATDETGNTATVEGSLTVYDVSVEVVEEMVEEILFDILEDGMTQLEQAQAIFDFVQGHIRYGSNRIYDNVNFGAYMAWLRSVGDCYSYYALSEVLLNGAGIENIPIKRRPGYPTRHFWNLVNLGDGWYHFDAVRRPNLGGFMFTQSRAEYLTANARYTRGLYDYDKSLYPEVVP